MYNSIKDCWPTFFTQKEKQNLKKNEGEEREKQKHHFVVTHS